MTAIRTELPISTEPWERARSLFLEQLSPHERTVFEKADLETIYHDASVSHRQHQQSSKLQAARRRLAPLVDAIDGYGKGLDVMSNTPVAAAFLCPIWGGVRVALYVAQETEKYFEKLAEMLEKVGQTLPLFRDYQNLFRTHERLLQVLSEAYLNVLRFCTEVTALFKEAKTRAVSVVSLTVSCRTLWKPFTLRFAEYLKKFQDLKQQVQDEANVAHMIESKRERERQERNRALAKTRLREEKLRQTLQRFSPIDYHLTHRRLRSECHQGTAQWIFDHYSYKSWKESTESESIHCNGIPGCGKTILASSVVESLITNTVDPSHLICFYYCDYADHQSLDPAIMLGTFIRQILERSHQAEGLREWVLDQWADRNSSPLAQELLPALLNAFECFEHVTIIIDALDELSPQDQHECGSIISRFLGLDACQVKVFLSCRFEATVLNKAPQPRFSIALSPKLLSKDIYRFVEDMVQVRIDSKDLTIQDPALQQEIIHKLQEGAEDMFLWVKFQIAELCEAMSDMELRDILENLPRDLVSTYRRILHKIVSSTHGTEKAKLAERAFQWIACAKRPLTINELVEAVILNKNDTTFPAHRILTDGGTRLRLACGNLVVFDEEHGSVRFAHHTVQQFITDPSIVAEPADGPVKLPCFLLDHAEREVYALCVAYLSFTDFGTQIACCDSSAPNISESGGFVPSLINYMLPDSGVVGRLTTLLKGQPHSTSNLNNWSLSIQGNTSRIRRENELKRKYSLLDYISTWWCFHSPGLFGDRLEASCFNQTKPSSKYYDMGVKTMRVCEKQFPFPHRPWDNDDLGGSSQRPSTTNIPMFRWAARSGNLGFWNLRMFGASTHTPFRMVNSIVTEHFLEAMMYDNNERNLLADILHGGNKAILDLYFEAVRGSTIGAAIPAYIIYQAVRLAPKSRHATFFAELQHNGFHIARGTEIRSFWQRGPTIWFDNKWPATHMSRFDEGAGTFLLEEAVKQDDIDFVRCILENKVGEVVYFATKVRWMSANEMPLARAVYENNVAMVEVLFSYINGTAPWVGAEIATFDLRDLYDALRTRNLVPMIELVETLSCAGLEFPGPEHRPRRTFTMSSSNGHWQNPLRFAISQGHPNGRRDPSANMVSN